MCRKLREYTKFVNDEEYMAVKATIGELVRSGSLTERGLAPSVSCWFVELYEDDQGDTWRLVIPDQAFRGFLKKTVEHG